MQKIYSKGFNGWSQLAILLGLVGGGLIVGGIVVLPIWKIMTGASIMNLEADMLKPQYATAAQTIQVVSTIFMFLLPVVIYAFICYKNGWAFLGFGQKLNNTHLLIALLVVVCSVPLISALEEINKMIPLPPATRLRFDNMEKKYNEQVLAMIQLKSWGQYFISICVIALLPAVTEELLFRGGLQNLLSLWTRSPWFSIVLTALLFSAVHLSWYGFFARFFLGMILGAIFYYTQNIWLNILVHFINNAFVVTVLFAATKKGQQIDMAAEQNMPLWSGAIALVLMLLLVRWLMRTSQARLETDLVILPNSNNPFDEKDIANL